MKEKAKKQELPKKIKIIKYSEKDSTESEIVDLDEIDPDSNDIVWLDVESTDDKEVVETIANKYNFHPLIKENIFDDRKRPAVDDDSNQISITLSMVDINTKSKTIVSENVTIVLGPRYLISFQGGEEGDVWQEVRNKLRTGKCRLRKTGTDYLAYSLMDAVVEKYFTVLEFLGDKIETLEQEVITKPNPSSLKKIYHLKRQITSVRKSVWPVRELINNLTHSENNLIEKSTLLYFRDIYEHTVQIIDTIELNREILTSMLDIYLSSVSNSLNTVMKVLTVVATIFIPLTFITSLYGMNFVHMPELKWKYGYLMVWAIMLTIALGMLIYFKRKGWFNARPF